MEWLEQGEMMDRYKKNLPERFKADYEQSMEAQQEANMTDDEYRAIQAKVEDISQQIVDLHSAIDRRLDVTASKRKAMTGLMKSLQNMNGVKKTLYEIYRQTRKIVA